MGQTQSVDRYAPPSPPSDTFGMPFTFIVIAVSVLLILLYFNFSILLRWFRGANIDLEQIKWLDRPLKGYGSDTPKKAFAKLKSATALGAPSEVTEMQVVWDGEELQQANKRMGSCWDRIVLKNEMIPHDEPKPHVDFLHVFLHLPNVGQDQMQAIKSISASVNYDMDTGMLSVRCGTLQANAATAWLVTQVLSGRKTPEEAKKQYGRTISSALSDDEAYKRLLKQVCAYKNSEL